MATEIDAQGVVKEAVLYELYCPKSSQITASSAMALVEQITNTFPKCILRIAAERRKVTWQVLVLHSQTPPTNIAPIIRSVIPGAEVEVKPYTLPTFSANTTNHFSAPLVQSHHWFVPTARLDKTENDPLIYVVQSLAEAVKQDAIVYYTLSMAGQWNNQNNQQIVDEARRKTMGLPSDAEKVGATLINIGGFIGSMFYKTFEEGMLEKKVNWGDYKPLVRHSPPPPPNEIQKRALEKVDTFKKQSVYALLEVYASGPELIGNILANTLTHLESSFTDIGTYVLAPPSLVGKYEIHKADSQERLNQFGLPGYITWLNQNPSILQKVHCIATLGEVAALWHLPHSAMDLPEVNFLHAGRPSKAILENETGIAIGQFNEQPIHMMDIDRLSHVNIVGKSGTGKSTFMLNLIKQDIERGRGVGVIDPHGKLVADILATAIPPERQEDVVVIDVADLQHPPPLNPLRLTDIDGRVASGQLTAILESIYGDANRYPRADVFLRSAIQTLNYETTPTVRDIVRLFQDIEYRMGILQKAEDVGALDDATYAFWNDVYAGLSEAQQRDYPFPVIHRISTFYGSDFLYPMLCHPDALDWLELMRDSKIILISLAVDTAKVSEKERQLLGTLALSQMEIAAKRQGHARPLDFYLYVDEVQRFTNTALPAMFEEIRKYGIHLTVANQYLGQLQGEMLSALMGNVGATFVFEVGKDDARELEIYTEPIFTRNDLTSLGKYHTVAVMKLNDRPQSAFDFSPLSQPPTRANADEITQTIREQSKRKYTPKTRDEVLQWLKSRYPRRKFSFSQSTSPANWGEPETKN